MNRGLRVAGAVVVALTLLGANGVAVAGAGDVDQTSYRRKIVEDADISVSYPRTWTVVPITHGELDKARRRLAAQNPEFTKRFDDAANSQLVEAARFRATDLTVARYQPTIAVGTLSGRFPNPGEFELLEQQFGQAGFGVMDTSRPKFGREKAYRIDLARSLNLPDGTPIPLRLTELLVPGGEGITFVAIATEDTPEGHALIDDLASRVRPA
jgi:hypothetical protein